MSEINPTEMKNSLPKSLEPTLTDELELQEKTPMLSNSAPNDADNKNEVSMVNADEMAIAADEVLVLNEPSFSSGNQSNIDASIQKGNNLMCSYLT